MTEYYYLDEIKWKYDSQRLFLFNNSIRQVRQNDWKKLKMK